jgi:hypothetical protein
LYADAEFAQIRGEYKSVCALVKKEKEIDMSFAVVPENCKICTHDT